MAFLRLYCAEPAFPKWSGRPGYEEVVRDSRSGRLVPLTCVHSVATDGTTHAAGTRESERSEAPFLRLYCAGPAFPKQEVRTAWL